MWWLGAGVLTLLVTLVVVLARQVTSYRSRLNATLATTLKQQNEIDNLVADKILLRGKAFEELRAQERRLLDRITLLRQTIASQGKDLAQTQISARVADQHFKNIIKTMAAVLRADGIKAPSEFSIEAISGLSAPERVLACLIHYISKAETEKVMLSNTRKESKETAHS